MGSKSSSSSSSSSSSDTHDNKIAADGEAIVVRNEGGDVVYNNTADIAVELTEIAAQAIQEAAQDAIQLADSAGDDARDLSASAFDFANVAAENNRQATAQALETVEDGFMAALEEAREDNLQIASEIMSYAVPIVALYFLYQVFK